MNSINCSQMKIVENKSFFLFVISSYTFKIKFIANVSFDICIYKNNILICCILNLSRRENIFKIVNDFCTKIYDHLLLCTQLMYIYRHCECVENILEQAKFQIPPLPGRTNSLQFLLDNIYGSFSELIVVLHASRFSHNIAQQYIQTILKAITFLNWAGHLHEHIKNLDSFHPQTAFSTISEIDEKSLKELITQFMIQEKMSFFRLFQAELYNRMQSSSPSLQTKLDKISLDLFFPPSPFV